ncbi:MAG: LysR substrate-binding domain-containing protein [Acidobacteriota bacterium]
MKGLGSVAIRDLRAILVLADTLHFGRAAERCGIAQASLSTLVKRVESAAGVQIFHRTSRRCEVAPEGVAVLESIERLLRALEDVENAQQTPEALRGIVRLGFIPTLGPYLIPHLLPALTERFPEARFYFFEALTEQLIGKLRERQIDVGFFSFPSRAEALVERPLFKEELVLAMPREHALTSRQRIAVTELPRKELILMDHGHCLRDHTLQLCGEGRSQAPVHATSLETLRFMVGSGVGCAVLPALALAAAGQASDLVVYRKFEDPVPTRTVGLVTLPEPIAQRRAEALIDLGRSLSLPKMVPDALVPA